MSRWHILRLVAASLFVGYCLCLFFVFPTEVLRSALHGVSIWWNVLFPALFPFFVCSELFIGLGIVHFIGTLLDPMMRPIFRVPGSGGFVMAMGFASGYPIASRMALQLWKQKQLNKTEAERLIAFATTADPIFLISAICLGFFQDIRLAVIIFSTHYLGAVLVGIAMRFYLYRNQSPCSPQSTDANQIKRAFTNMHQARLQDQRSISTLLTDAIYQAFQLLFIIGGLVVFFSVLLAMWKANRFLDALEWCIYPLFTMFGMSTEFISAFIYGLFEVTIGTQTVAQQTSSSPLLSKLAFAAFLLAWAGLSVHTQILSITSEMNLNYRIFASARFLHGCVSAGLVIIFWKLFVSQFLSVFNEVPVFGEFDKAVNIPHVMEWMWIFPFLILICCLLLLSFLSMILHVCCKMNGIFPIRKS